MLFLITVLALAAGGRVGAAPLPPPAGTLGRLATDYAGKLGPALEGRRVPSMDLLLQVRLPPGHYTTGLHKLAGVVRKLAAARLKVLGLRSLHLAPARLGEQEVLALARRQGFELALPTRVVLAGGRLHLRGKLYDTHVPLWGRLTRSGVRLLAHLHVSQRVDPEIRSYLALPSRSAVTCSGRFYKLGPERFLEVALGDVDADGRQEVVLLGSDRILIQRWSVVYPRFDQVAEVKLTAPLARVRPRFPLASLVVEDLDGDRRADILARVSKRSTAVHLVRQGAAFVAKRRLDGYPFGAAHLGRRWHVAVGRALPGKSEFRGRSVRWWPRRAGRLRLPPVFRNLRLARFKTGRQGARTLQGVVGSSGTLTIRQVPSGRLVQRLARVGVAFALGDLTGDGRPEVVTTSHRPFATTDTLTVQRLGQTRPLCQVKGFGGSVMSLAVGDVDHDGRADVAAVIWNARLGRSYLLVVR